MYFKLRVVVACGFCLFTMLFASCTKTPEGFAVGVVVPLSGDASNYGKACQQGIDLAFRETNASGGVLKRQIRAIYEDDKALAREGVNATQKLVNVDHVSVIIGGIVSAVTLAAAPIVEANRVVWLSPTSSAPAITHAGEFIFRNWPSDDLEGRVMAEFIHSRGIKDVAILQVQNEYGEGIQQVFSARFTSKSGHLVALEKYAQNETVFRSVLSKVLSRSPQALYAIGYYTDVALMAKQLRETDRKTQFFATTTIEDPQFLKIGGTSVNGIIYPLASGYDAESNDSLVARFRSTFSSAYGSQPGFVAAQCYDSANLVKLAVEKGGGFDGEKIQKGMAGIRGFHGVTGVTTFDENGDVVKEIKMKIVKNGAFVPFSE